MRDGKNERPPVSCASWRITNSASRNPFDCVSTPRSAIVKIATSPPSARSMTPPPPHFIGITAHYNDEGSRVSRSLVFIRRGHEARRVLAIGEDHESLTPDV